MDINQLTSIVRQRRADNQADAYMDEVLTAVLEADDKIAQAKKDLAALQRQVADQQVKLSDFNKALTTREADHAAKLAQLEKDSAKHLEAAEGVHKANLAQLQVDAENQRKALENAIKLAEDKLKGLNADCIEAWKKREQVLGEVSVIKDSLSKLQDERKEAEGLIAKAEAEMAQIRSRLNR